MTSILQTWHRLLQNIVTGKYSMLFISELEAIKSQYPLEEEIQVECEIWKAKIYSMNGFKNKAQQIYGQLIDKPILLSGYFASVLLEYLKLLHRVGNVDMAERIFKGKIHSKQLSFVHHIELFTWYIGPLDPLEDDLRLYSYMYTSIENTLGYWSDKVTLRERILDLNRTHQIVVGQYTLLMLSCTKKTNDEIEEMVNNFLSSNPPRYYRKLAQQLIKNLEGR